MRRFLFLLLLIQMAGLEAQQNDWENEQVFGVNKELAHNTYVPYASLKQGMIAKEHLGRADVDCHIFFMDMRAPIHYGRVVA